jgi:hypothetical protein
MLDRITQSTFDTMSKSDLYSIGWIAIIVCGVLLLFLFEPKTRSSFRRYSRYRSSYTPYQFEKRPIPDLSDVAQQLHAVMGASFEKQRVLSNSEYRVFRIVEAEVTAERRGYRVFAQTSLGEVLRAEVSNYYTQSDRLPLQLGLAEIARLFRVHRATISRVAAEARAVSLNTEAIPDSVAPEVAAQSLPSKS